MRYRQRVFACALVLTLSAFGGLTTPGSADGGDVAEANAISALLTRVAPASAANPRVALSPDGRAGGPLNGKAPNGTTISIPTTSSGRVNVATADSARTLRVGLPALSGSKDGAVAADGTVVFISTTRSSAIAIQAFAEGVRVYVVLRSAQADSAYAFAIDVPTGGTIQPLADGGLVVAGADNSFHGGFAPPWAKDSAGRSVPTHYDVRGSTVVQVIDHSSSQVAYPVVADPYLGLTLIDHAIWTYHPGDGFTFEVTPTFWARVNAGSYNVGSYGWDELYARYSCCGLNTNLQGMRDQYICHQVFVAIREPGKATWNIDEWRPNVGWFETLNTQCNPGGPRFFD